MTSRLQETDWHKRFKAAKPPHVVTLPSDFAGVKAGSTMLISSPAEIAAYVASIPRGQRRTIARLRSDLAKRAQADAMCPVTTAIYLRIVAETALRDLELGQDMTAIVPFWRVISAGDKLAARLSCGKDVLLHLQLLDDADTVAN